MWANDSPRTAEFLTGKTKCYPWQALFSKKPWVASGLWAFVQILSGGSCNYLGQPQHDFCDMVMSGDVCYIKQGVEGALCLVL